ncbi:MAG: PIN domain-containing protein [Candidatus Paceibacterota bacterium]|jgi:predicted nucleic acid-binding protein
MKLALDSSVVIAALDASDPDHSACRRLMLSARLFLYGHALSESFSTLTGGSLGLRLSAATTASILRDNVVPRVAVVHLTEGELLDAYEDSTRRGIRGGAIYDYLHLVAARKAGAAKLYTLNLGDFRAFHRPGDPEIACP